MVAAPTSKLGQRRDSRLRLELPARLITLDGYASALMCDLSQSGVRVRLRPGQTLRVGAEAMLSWLEFEAFGAVVWSDDRYAGMEFDGLLDPEIVLVTREMIDLGRAVTEEQLSYDQARRWYEGER